MKHKTISPLQLTAILWISASLVYLVAEAVTAASFPDYSYATNYISDLGVPDIGYFQGRALNSPLHNIMNAAFISQGLLFFLGTLSLLRVVSGPRKWLVTLGLCVGSGWVMIGSFAGNQVNADNGLLVFHIGGAVLSILGSLAFMLTVMALGSRFGAPSWYLTGSLVLTISSIASAIMLLVDSGSTFINIFPDGVWERGISYGIIFWQLLTGMLLLITGKTGATNKKTPSISR